jgi:hypothetical protein
MIVQATLGFIQNNKNIGERRDKLETPNLSGDIYT